MKYVFLAVITIFLLVGCTTVKIKNDKLAEHSKLSFICIEDNPKVIVSDFVSVVETRFAHYGIATKSYQKSSLPAFCDYILTYTARQSWDITTFMKYAELHIKYKGNEIGKAVYRHAGGLALNKWDPTEKKLNPVIDELLSGFEAGKDVVQSGEEIHRENSDQVTTTQDNTAQKLRELKALKDEGVITDEEFVEKKRELLDRL